jgi:hypothetical protein
MSQCICNEYTNKYCYAKSHYCSCRRADYCYAINHLCSCNYMTDSGNINPCKAKENHSCSCQLGPGRCLGEKTVGSLWDPEDGEWVSYKDIFKHECVCSHYADCKSFKHICSCHKNTAGCKAKKHKCLCEGNRRKYCRSYNHKCICKWNGLKKCRNRSLGHFFKKL